jgi:hypothetical protein
MEGLLAHRLLEVVEDWCIHYVPADDDSRANEVLLGKPTKELRDEIVVSIYMNHPLSSAKGGQDLVEGTPRNQRERPYHWPAETWGGMRTEMLVGAVQVNYRQKEAYEDAMTLIGPVVTRIKQGINQDMRLDHLEDDMGNFMSKIETFTAEGVSSGGANITVDRTWVSWRAFIHSTNERTTLS